MSTKAARRFRRGARRVGGMPVPPRVISPLAAGVLAAAALLSACNSEPTAITPELVTRGSSGWLRISPSSLLLTSPGLSKTFTATVQSAGMVTASSSNPRCATVSPTRTRSTDKPGESSVYVAQFTVAPVGAGSCTLTITDRKGNVAYVGVSVVLARIAFSSPRNQTSYQIYVMDPDGKHQVPVTKTSSEEFQPAWSPDRTRIAFMSRRDANPEIYVMDADGQHQTRLTNNPADDSKPAWSPDGTKIAFASLRDGEWNIYVMDPDGQHPTRLTNNTAADYWPTWSPDGSKIAFVSGRDGNPEIYVMDADGLHPTRLTNNLVWDGNPAWSPDGTKFAFASYRDGDLDIYVMDAADGQNQSRLTNNDWEDDEPTWSPSGTQIAFQSTPYDIIYVMNADGQNPTPLTDGSAEEEGPAWR